MLMLREGGLGAECGVWGVDLDGIYGVMASRFAP